MENRKGLSKKIRFEILKRDCFTCVYCGAKAPDATLAVDHIKPVKLGGTNDIENLVTACTGCNLGKHARELTDKQVIHKSFNQLKESQQKINQLKEAMRWREEITKNKLEEEDLVVEHIEEIIDTTLTEYGRNGLLEAYRKLGIEKCQEHFKAYIEDDKKRIDRKAKRYSFLQYARFTDSMSTPQGKIKYITAIALAHFSRGYCYSVVIPFIKENMEHLEYLEREFKKLPFGQYYNEKAGEEFINSLKENIW